MTAYQPPFHITEKMISLIAEISEQVGRIIVLQHGALNPHLRRENRIRTIYSPLAIEHNSLSLEQVTAIINGKRILGNPNEIKEVQNAYDAYELLLQLDESSVNDLLKAHKLMMGGLVKENGRFRSEGVGVFDGDRLVHMAPPAEFVPEHINNLFQWYNPECFLFQEKGPAQRKLCRYSILLFPESKDRLLFQLQLQLPLLMH